MPLEDVVPTSIPRDDSHVRVASSVAGVGPKTRANCPAAR